MAAAPLIHWANEEPRHAQISLLCRVSIPAATGVLVAPVASIGGCKGLLCSLGWVLAGMAGFGAAALVVAAVDSITAVAEDDADLQARMVRVGLTF